MFPENLNLDNIKHLCRVQPNQPVTKEQIYKILGMTTDELNDKYKGL